jgi:HemY protein
LPELALVASQRAHQLAADPSTDEQDREQATTLVRHWLAPLWPNLPSLSASQQRQFVLALEPGLSQLDAAGLAQLEQAQRQQPGNVYLQYLAGQACMQRQLWGKAAQLLGQASHGLKDAALLRRTWCSLARLAEERDDEIAAQSAWKKAALLD